MCIISAKWKDGVSEPSAYDNMKADVGIFHWLGRGLMVKVWYGILAV